jgi:hypothetical protein
LHAVPSAWFSQCESGPMTSVVDSFAAPLAGSQRAEQRLAPGGQSLRSNCVRSSGWYAQVL